MSIKKYYNIAKTKLFPITRSLTGNGVKKTLKLYKKNFLNLKLKNLNQVQKFLIGIFQKNGM